MKPKRTKRALWRHYPEEEFNTDRFVGATVRFQERYQFDLIKVTPRSSFCLRDYGSTDTFDGNPLGVPTYLDSIVADPHAWRSLSALDPRKGCLGQQLECLKAIRSLLGNKTPLVQTIFSPITQAKFLCQPPRLKAQWKENRSELLYGLSVLHESTLRFVDAISPYVDGIYYVITEAGEPELQDLVYSQQMIDRDAQILSAHPWKEKILHLHTQVLDFKHFCSYPVNTLHWDEEKLGVSMREGQSAFPGIVSGGMSWTPDKWTNPMAIEAQARGACKDLDRDRFMISTGCVIPYQSTDEHIMAFRNADC